MSRMSPISGAAASAANCRIFVWAIPRVATAQQKLDLLADGIYGYAAHAGVEIVAKYLDRAISGRQQGRPQLQALMRAARQHEFACVLRPATPAQLVSRIEALAGTTGMSVRQIQEAFGGQVSRSVVGDIVKHVRAQSHTSSLL